MFVQQKQHFEFTTFLPLLSQMQVGLFDVKRTQWMFVQIKAASVLSR